MNYDRRDNFLIDAVDDGFTLDPFRDVISGRLSAKFDISDSIDLTLVGDYSSQTGVVQDDLPLVNLFPEFFPGAPIPPGSSPLFNPGDSDARRTDPFPQQGQAFRDNENYGIAGELNVDIGPGTLTYLGSYREFIRDDFETGVFGLVAVATFADYTQQSHELRYAFEVDSFRAQAGAYYFRESSFIELNVGNGAVVVPTVPGVDTLGIRQDPTISESIAVFGQSTYNLTDRLPATGAIRFTNDEKSREVITFITFPFPLPGGVPAGAEIPIINNDAAVDINEVTWRGGLEYNTDAGLIFASVSRGYKAGGFNDGCEIGTAPVCDQPADVLFYDPESLIAHEIGTKLSFAEGRVRLNATAFLYDYSDLQLSSVAFVSGSPSIVIQNATSADIQGIEVDALITPSDRNQIDLALTLLDSEFGDFEPFPGINFEGRSLDRSPGVTFAAGYRYTLPLPGGSELVGRVRSKLTDSYTITDFGQAVTFEQPSFTRTDVSLTYFSPDGRFSL